MAAHATTSPISDGCQLRWSISQSFNQSRKKI